MEIWALCYFLDNYRMGIAVVGARGKIHGGGGGGGHYQYDTTKG